MERVIKHNRNWKTENRLCLVAFGYWRLHQGEKLGAKPVQLCEASSPCLGLRRRNPRKPLRRLLYGFLTPLDQKGSMIPMVLTGSRVQQGGPPVGRVHGTSIPSFTFSTIHKLGLGSRGVPH